MNSISIGNSGEYFVAGELERRGFTCAVPMSGTKDFDILVINRDNNNQYAIQVKTARNKTNKWILNKKCEDLVGDNIYYVFVALNGLESPDYHIIPSKIVADTVRREHENWLHLPGKNGQVHNDTSVRNFIDYDNKYLDRWDLLK